MKIKFQILKNLFQEYDKKIAIILGSARKNSDINRYVDFVFKEINHKKIDLLDYDISTFSYTNSYADTDSFLKLIDEILETETIVFATPVYWYSMSGLMKTFFDRLTELVKTKKEIGRKFKNKSVLLLVVGSDKEIPPGFDIPFKLTSEYFDMEYKTHLYFSTTHIKTEKQNSEKKRFFLNYIIQAEAKKQLMNQLKYLVRLRLDVKRKLEPSVETLIYLQKAHLLNIPFERLDIHTNTKIDLNNTFDKIVINGLILYS